MLENVITGKQLRIDEQASEINALRTRHEQVEKFGKLKREIVSPSISPPFKQAAAAPTDLKSSQESVRIGKNATTHHTN